MCKVNWKIEERYSLPKHFLPCLSTVPVASLCNFSIKSCCTTGLDNDSYYNIIPMLCLFSLTFKQNPFCYIFMNLLYWKIFFLLLLNKVGLISILIINIVHIFFDFFIYVYCNRALYVFMSFCRILYYNLYLYAKHIYFLFFICQSTMLNNFFGYSIK